MKNIFEKQSWEKPTFEKYDLEVVQGGATASTLELTGTFMGVVFDYMTGP